MADIKINKQQWDALSQEDQNAITQGLRSTGGLKSGDRIVGDPKVPPFGKNTQLAPLWNPIQDLCKAACDVAAGTAGAWCTANTAGAGLVVCLAAAEAARQECHNRC
jgi:hypothetical protein